MAVRTRGNLFLLITLFGLAYLSCASGLRLIRHEVDSEVEGASRKLLSTGSTSTLRTHFLKNSEENPTFHEDYAPATTHPPTNDDYPPPPFPVVERDDIPTDYGNPSTNPPVHTDPPPPALASVPIQIQDLVDHEDYAGASANPPNPDYGPPLGYLP